MKLDLKFHTGKPELPAAVLIHGLGMNRYFWGDPEECPVFGGLTSLAVFLSGPPGEDNPAKISLGRPNHKVKSIYDRLIDAGISVAAWTQLQPYSQVDAVIQELQAVLREVGEKWPGKQLYCIGHSRGGLIARKYLLDGGNKGIAGLITLGCPHAGSKLAMYTAYLQPLALVLEKMIPKESRGKMAAALTRLSIFLKSPATVELEPGSDFIASMKRPLPGKLRMLSFGGTDPSLLKIYLRPKAAEPWKSFAFPDLLLRAIPSNRLPDELKTGLGDGVVSAQSAVLQGGKHYDLPQNHVRLVFDEAVQKRILNFLLADGGTLKRQRS